MMASSIFQLPITEEKCSRIFRKSETIYFDNTSNWLIIKDPIPNDNYLSAVDQDLNEFDLRPNMIDSFSDAIDEPWRCGVLNSSRNSRLSYFTRIIGGRPATPGDWPWQVAVLNRFRVRFDSHSGSRQPNYSRSNKLRYIIISGSILRRYFGISEVGPHRSSLHPKEALRPDRGARFNG